MPSERSADASELASFFRESDSSFGVFYPKHYIFATFSSFEETERAAKALRKSGIADDDVMALNGAETLTFFREFHQHAGLWGGLMTELSKLFNTEEAFVEEDMARARRGAGFLAVYTKTETRANQVRQAAAPFHPVAMHWYLPGAVQSLI